MKKLILFLSLFFILPFSAGCLGGAHPFDEKNQLVFIEYWGTLSSEILSGEGPPLLMIDFPTYRYREENGILASYLGIFGPDPEKIDPSTVCLILGNGLSLSGDAGGGASSGLHGINNLPHHPDSSTSYLLAEMDQQGAVLVKPRGMVLLMGLSISNPLPVNGVWIAPGKTLVFQTVEVIEVQQATIRFMYTISLKNRLVRRDRCLNSPW